MVDGVLPNSEAQTCIFCDTQISKEQKITGLGRREKAVSCRPIGNRHFEISCQSGTHSRGANILVGLCTQ